MQNQLFIYLDESGDLGFNFENKGTARYFIITLLACDKTGLTTIQTAAKKTLKNKISSKHKELKGTATTIEVKKYFYRHAEKSTDWHLYSLVLDKTKLKSKIKNLPSEQRIYNYLANEILKHVDLTLINSHLLLTVDKRKDRRGISEFNRYLSYHLEATLPLNASYKILHEHSHNNPALQAVDLFCWGIRRFREYGDDAWLSVYRHRLTLVDADDFTGIKKDGP